MWTLSLGEESEEPAPKKKTVSKKKDSLIHYFGIVLGTI